MRGERRGADERRARRAGRRRDSHSLYTHVRRGSRTHTCLVSSEFVTPLRSRSGLGPSACRARSVLGCSRRLASFACLRHPDPGLVATRVCKVRALHPGQLPCLMTVWCRVCLCSVHSTRCTTVGCDVCACGNFKLGLGHCASMCIFRRARVVWGVRS